MSPTNRSTAFTLIELLISVTIIGILAIALIPRLTGGPERARDAQRKTDILQYAEALEFYANDNGGNYPALLGSYTCVDGIELSTALSAYLDIAPSDPRGIGVGAGSKKCSTNYTYFPLKLSGSTIPNGYMLFALLENESIADDSAYYWSINFQSSLAASNTAQANLATLSTCDIKDCSTGAMFVLGR